MADLQPIIIIRRKKKGGAAGHHGGAWKVAYADFVTAMMAFFLLLWLLNVTTDEQRHGIADYFTPASSARSESGAGGTMGGQSISAPGAMTTQGSPPYVQAQTIPSAGQGEEGDEDTVGKSDHGSDGPETGVPKAQQDKTNPDKEHESRAAPDKAGQDKVGQDKVGQGKESQNAATDTHEPVQTAAEAAAQAKREAVENEKFTQATEQLKQAIQQSEELKGLADQLMIEQTPEGLRIQIVDKENSSMFPSGSSILYEKSRELLALMGKVLARLTNKITIAGHTDSAPFTLGSRRDNWTLSTERANICRQALEGAGVASLRIARVIGMADREPLDVKPNAPKNRRISITLLRQNNAVDDLEKPPTLPVNNPPAGTEIPKSLEIRKPNEPILPSVLPATGFPKTR
jgi:chemotaxis protein MotB